MPFAFGPAVGADLGRRRRCCRPHALQKLHCRRGTDREARRCLSFAAVLDGMSRGDAARISEMDR